MKNFFKTVSYKKALEMGPRKFVKDYLFPAMRREHGLGFAMETWSDEFKYNEEPAILDDLSRKIPVCRTVMCIGGTMQAITNERDAEKLSQLLGIPYLSNSDSSVGHMLFYEWDVNIGPWKGLARKFREAKTPAQKEKIAEKAVLAAIKIGEKAKKARKV